MDEDVAARHGWSVPALARAYLDGGATLLQVRAKRAPAAVLLAMAAEVVGMAKAVGARVIVNDRADVAALAGAEGVHVGQDDLPVGDVRRAFPGLPLVGLSTHTPAQVAAAIALAPGYVAVGPVFRTATKDTGYDEVGLDLVRHARQALDAAGPRGAPPLVAIGGITLERAGLVLEAGATSVAVISDLLAGNDPAGRVRAYLALRKDRR